jgi:DNA-binding MarR family transcriptional regulator
MPESAPSAAAVRAWVCLVKAQHKVLGAVEADLRKAGFPPLGWYDVLLELRRAGERGLRQLEIEGKLLLAQHNVSRLVDRLEKARLASRGPAPEDGRGQLVGVTPEGRELLARMWPAYGEAIRRHVGAKLGDDAEAETLSRLLTRLIEG